MKFTRDNFTNEIDYSPNSETELSANFLMFLSDAQYEEIEKRAGVNPSIFIDEDGDPCNTPNVFAEISMPLFLYESFDSKTLYHNSEISMTMTYDDENNQYCTKDVPLTVEEKKELFAAMNEYCKEKEKCSLTEMFIENQQIDFCEFSEKQPDILKGHCSIADNRIDLIADNAVAASLVLDSDELYDKIAKTINLYKVCNVADYNELLYDSDITLCINAVIGDYDRGFYIEAQSESLWRSFVLPLNDNDKQAVVNLIIDCAEKNGIEGEISEFSKEITQRLKNTHQQTFSSVSTNAEIEATDVVCNNRRFVDILDSIGFNLERDAKGICLHDYNENSYMLNENDKVIHFDNAAEIAEQLDTYLCSHYLDDIENEFNSYDMKGEMPEQSFEKWVKYGEKCKNGDEKERLFYTNHKTDFEDMRLIAYNIDKVDIRKIFEDKDKEKQNQSVKKAKSNYTDLD